MRWMRRWWRRLTFTGITCYAPFDDEPVRPWCGGSSRILTTQWKRVSCGHCWRKGRLGEWGNIFGATLPDGTYVDLPGKGWRQGTFHCPHCDEPSHFIYLGLVSEGWAVLDCGHVVRQSAYAMLPPQGMTDRPPIVGWEIKGKVYEKTGTITSPPRYLYVDPRQLVERELLHPSNEDDR